MKQITKRKGFPQRLSAFAAAASISAFGAFSLVGVAGAVDVNGCDFTKTATTWSLNDNCVATAQITVDESVTVEGNNHTISGSFAKTGNDNNSIVGVQADNVVINNLSVDGTGSLAWPNGLHGVNVYQSENVQLNNVTVKNMSYSGVNVNASTVTVNNITTQNNGWHGIDVDKGVAGTMPAILTVTGVSHHTDARQIYVDHFAVGVNDVIDVNDQYTYVDNPADPDNNTDDRLYTLRPKVAASKEDCKSNGWMNVTTMDRSSFKNQGQCVAYTVSNDNSKHHRNDR